MQSCGCISELRPVGIRSVIRCEMVELFVVHWRLVTQVHTLVVMVLCSIKLVNPYLQDAWFRCGEIHSTGALGGLRVLSLLGDILYLVVVLWPSCNHQVP